ncbi:MAG: ferredoxin--NADP reductase [Chloroflexi bacterium]|nr:ferredoxin--NADP reductase [Chloroflexota bacterium]
MTIGENTVVAGEGDDSRPAYRTDSLPQANLVYRRDITEDLMVIKLEPLDGPFSFKPGQYCTLGKEGVERAYSIVSAPHEPQLEIFVELVPDGELTPKMWRLQPGENMSLRPRPKGIFTLNEKVHHHLMVATVTGVGPYLSIIREYLHQGGEGHHFYVLLGASYQDELTYDTELVRLAEEHPECVKFVATVSRPQEERNVDWEGEKGRVNNIVLKYLEEFNLPKDDTMVYTCGHPGMIEDVREQVTPLGWQFKEERFWKE